VHRSQFSILSRSRELSFLAVSITPWVQQVFHNVDLNLAKGQKAVVIANTGLADTNISTSGISDLVIVVSVSVDPVRAGGR